MSKGQHRRRALTPNSNVMPHEPRLPVVKLSPPADMPFTRAAAIQMLRWGADPNSSPYTHKQIAEWCDRFWCKYLDVDAEPEIESLLPTLTGSMPFLVEIDSTNMTASGTTARH